MTKPASPLAVAADLSYQAVSTRHFGPVWGLPGTVLARTAWPASTGTRAFVRWHYWWQAHVLELLVDAAERRYHHGERLIELPRRIREHTRGVVIRNLSPVTRNSYYDDKAWMTLAWQRACDSPAPLLTSATLARRQRGVERLLANLAAGIDPEVGALPWNSSTPFYNAPSNGPAAIAFARAARSALTGVPGRGAGSVGSVGRGGERREEAETWARRAHHLTRWMIDTLTDERSLVLDGVRDTAEGRISEGAIFSYNQGLLIGACLETAAVLEDLGTPDDGLFRVAGLLVEAAAGEFAEERDGTRPLALPNDGGDGGLFPGVLVRYLALAAQRLSGSAAETARALVLDSAEADRRTCAEVDGLPLHGPSWTVPATVPDRPGATGMFTSGTVLGSEVPERDLSVQLSGWMLRESAARLSQ